MGVGYPLVAVFAAAISLVCIAKCRFMLHIVSFSSILQLYAA